MGKMLIEKLLRSCPNLDNIYLLIRPKKGKDIHTRVEEIFDDAVRYALFLNLFFLQGCSCITHFYLFYLSFTGLRHPPPTATEISSQDRGS